MNILNKEQFLKHMDPKNNYLHSGSIIEDVRASHSQVINVEPENEVEVIEESLEVVEKRRVGDRNPNVPDFLRTTIAELAQEPGTKQTDIANHFGVSQSVVSKAANGIITYNNGKDEKLAEVVKTKQDEIQDEALDKTLHALKLLTVDDIGLLGAKDKADVAVKLSKVADNLRDKKNEGNDNRVQFIIMAPPVRESVHYEEIPV